MTIYSSASLIVTKEPIPCAGRVGVKVLAPTTKFSFNNILVFETAYIGKNSGYKIVDILKRNYFYTRYFFMNVVIIKV